MNWVYERAVRHNGLNYHLWSADGAEPSFALTRTSAIPPQNGRLYRSLRELAARTGVRVVPPDTSSSAEWAPAPPVRSAVGLYRTDDGWAQVDYGNAQGPVPRDQYEKNGYEPAFDQLMLEAKFRAASRESK